MLIIWPGMEKGSIRMRSDWFFFAWFSTILSSARTRLWGLRRPDSRTGWGLTDGIRGRSPLSILWSWPSQPCDSRPRLDSVAPGKGTVSLFVHQEGGRGNRHFILNICFIRPFRFLNPSCHLTVEDCFYLGKKKIIFELLHWSLFFI